MPQREQNTREPIWFGVVEAADMLAKEGQDGVEVGDVRSSCRFKDEKKSFMIIFPATEFAHCEVLGTLGIVHSLLPALKGPRLANGDSASIKKKPRFSGGDYIMCQCLCCRH